MFKISISDLIQTVAIIITIFFSTISIYQSQKAISLTEKAVIETSRPIISVYLEVFDTISFSKHLTIKNFGSSIAVIENLSFDTPLDEHNKNLQMASLISATIAPNQKFSTVLDDDFRNDIKGSLIYSDSFGNKYQEKFLIKTTISDKLLWQNSFYENESEESRAIKQSAEAIIRTLK